MKMKMAKFAEKPSMIDFCHDIVDVDNSIASFQKKNLVWLTSMSSDFDDDVDNSYDQK